jgi:hypothetical protein
MLVHLPAEVRANQEQMTAKMKTNQEKPEVRIRSAKRRERDQPKKYGIGWARIDPTLAP